MTFVKTAISFVLSAVALASSAALAETPVYTYGMPSSTHGGGTGVSINGSMLSAIDEIGYLDRSLLQINDYSPYNSRRVCLERGRTYLFWLGSFDFNPYVYLLSAYGAVDGRDAISHGEGQTVGKFYFNVPTFGGAPSCNAAYTSHGGGTGVSYSGALYQLIVNTKYTNQQGSYHLVVEKY